MDFGTGSGTLATTTHFDLDLDPDFNQDPDPELDLDIGPDIQNVQEVYVVSLYKLRPLRHAVP